MLKHAVKTMIPYIVCFLCLVVLVQIFRFGVSDLINISNLFTPDNYASSPSIQAQTIIVAQDPKPQDTYAITSSTRPGYNQFMDFRLKLSFVFPDSLQARVSEGVEKWREDVGNIRTIAIGDLFIIQGTTKDYNVGVGEGGGFYYTGEPIDLSKTDDDINKILTNKLYDVFDVKRTNFGYRKALDFYSYYSYSTISGHHSFLIPNYNSAVANIFINGPELVYRDLEVDRPYAEILKEANEYMKNGGYLSNEDVAKNEETFQEIMATLKFYE